MRSDRTGRVRLDLLAVILVLGTLVASAWAQTERLPGPPVTRQTPRPATPWSGESNAELTLMLLSVAVLVLLAGAKAIDLKRQRAAEAVRLQAQIADALLRERRLATLPVTASVHSPGWWGAPARIEMRGQVPTAELGEAVRHLAKQEASKSLAAFHIDDRIAVVPSMGARAA